MAEPLAVWLCQASNLVRLEIEIAGFSFSTAPVLLKDDRRFTAMMLNLDKQESSGRLKTPTLAD